ncbi:MAG: hypothetical protein FWE45_04200 [Firmicutes bacterium]|nr:hypothetical protein [Bacillota bacterium]
MHTGKIKDHSLNIYGCEHVIDIIKQLCKLLLSAKRFEQVFDKFKFISVKNGDVKTIQGMDVRFFDVIAKEPHFGFDINNNFLVFASDRPLHTDNYEKFKNCNWLLHEAYCIDGEKDTFKPHDKNHCTVKEASIVAKTLNAKNLVMWHTEDSSLGTRKGRYTKEAKEHFDGNIFVPSDLDVITVM